MKEKITHNMGLKIFSIILAILIWLIIINLADPVTGRTISGVEVEVVNDYVLEGYVYEIIEGKTVDVTLVGNRSVVDSIYKSDLFAYADLSNLSITNAVRVEVDVRRHLPNPPEITVNQMLKVSLEEVMTETKSVKVEFKGKVDEDHHLGDYEVKPNLVQVRGGVSVIDKIKSVRVEVDLSGADKNFKKKVEPKAYDENDRLVESNNLSFLVDEEPIETLTAIVKILDKKAIDIVPKITGEPAEGYVIADTEVVPNQILLAGTEKELSKIDAKEISVDVEQAKETVEVNLDNTDILRYLKDYDVRLVDEKELVTIRVNIEPLVTRTLEFAPNQDNVTVYNRPDNLGVSFIDERSLLSIDLRGLAEVVDQVTTDMVKCYIDVKGLNAGKHKVKLQYEPPDGVEVVSDKYKLEIELMALNEPRGQGVPPSM